MSVGISNTVQNLHVYIRSIQQNDIYMCIYKSQLTQWLGVHTILQSPLLAQTYARALASVTLQPLNITQPDSVILVLGNMYSLLECFVQGGEDS